MSDDRPQEQAATSHAMEKEGIAGSRVAGGIGHVPSRRDRMAPSRCPRQTDPRDTSRRAPEHIVGGGLSGLSA